ncbi:MAG: serine/threonine-protein kinase [Zavarzinella sp.]
MSAKKIGKYQIIAPLGKGANSTIFHIRREEDNREYALKMIPIEDADDAKYIEQAKHEYKVAQMLSHPNLIKIYSLEFRKSLFIKIKKVELLIEYLNAKPLDTTIVPLGQLGAIFAQVAAGLVHMHRRGVFHADLKPGNILYGKRGEVKIIDYGLSWIKGETKDRIQGTPEYMAPETAAEKTINETTDIYNFGATMYRLTTHELPPLSLSSDPNMILSAKTFHTMLKPVQELNKAVPKSLCDLIHACLKFKPEKRPQRMVDVFEELKKIADEMGTPIYETEE